MLVVAFPDACEGKPEGSPGNPSEWVSDTDRWSASALNERKEECGIWNQCLSRVFLEDRDAVASSSVL
jgi:hypothetical protein